jgi:hypothetical protein
MYVCMYVNTRRKCLTLHKIKYMKNVRPTLRSKAQVYFLVYLTLTLTLKYIASNERVISD